MKIFINICFKYNKVTEDWLFVTEMLCLAKNIKIIEKPTHVHRSFEPNTLAKKAGYIMLVLAILEVSKKLPILYKMNWALI